jgi:3-hydroxyacyl-CoA dehydrogenase/enoyl-CoA hydratase/3-hydroxybutyryl-CoA epimerase
VIRLPQTSPDVVATAHGFTQMIGKVPVVVNDSPGFVVNRILVPYLMEAVRLFESGHSIKDIDDAVLDFGMPMGPLRLLDEIGLDVAAHVALTLGVEPRFLDAMIAKGWLGKKNGLGFYLHGKPERINHEAMAMAAKGTPDIHPDDLQKHLAQMLTDEATRCLKDGVTSSAADIDLAMVLGTGYAPFRGGPLHYKSEILSNTDAPHAV